MTREGFIDGRGAIVSASRSILYPTPDPLEKNWQKSIARAVQTMAGQLADLHA
jgi:hypothetical protein